MFHFNNILNTFSLRLYGVGHMVKDQSESDRGNPLPPLHRSLFLISSKGCFFIHHPMDRIAHNMTFVTPEKLIYTDIVLSINLKFYYGKHHDT